MDGSARRRRQVIVLGKKLAREAMVQRKVAELETARLNNVSAALCIERAAVREGLDMSSESLELFAGVLRHGHFDLGVMDGEPEELFDAVERALRDAEVYAEMMWSNARQARRQSEHALEMFYEVWGG